MQYIKYSRGRINTQTLLIFLRTASRFCCDYIIFNKHLRLIPRRFKLLKLKFVFSLIVVILVLVYILFLSNLQLFKMNTTPTPLLVSLRKPEVEKKHINITKSNIKTLKIPSEAEFRRTLVERKLEKLSKHSERWEVVRLLSAIDAPLEPSTRVHIFYDISYGNPEINGKWKLWNEIYLSNTNISDESVRSQEKIKKPPLNIGSNYFPQLGCYSSNDPLIMKTHLKEIYDTGVGKNFY